MIDKNAFVDYCNTFIFSKDIGLFCMVDDFYKACNKLNNVLDLITL